MVNDQTTFRPLNNPMCTFLLSARSSLFFQPMMTLTVPKTHCYLFLSQIRRGTVALQAAVRGRAARGALKVERDASTRVAAWWRAVAEATRYRRTRRRVVMLQSLVRGRRGREEVAARWLVLGRRFSRSKAATMIQVPDESRSCHAFAKRSEANCCCCCWKVVFVGRQAWAWARPCLGCCLLSLSLLLFLLNVLNINNRSCATAT